MANLTLADVRTSVTALGFGMSVADEIDLAINSTQNRVCSMRRWPFLETETEQSVPADTTEVTLASFPVLLHRVDAARLFDGDTELDLMWVDPVEFRKREWILQDEVSGPFYWTRYRESILLRPETFKTYTLKLEGVASPAVLDSDLDETVIPGEYGEVLVWGAASHLSIRHRDWAMRQVAEEMFAKHLNAMLTAYVHDQRQNSNEVARWQGWDEVGGGRMMWRT